MAIAKVTVSATQQYILGEASETRSAEMLLQVSGGGSQSMVVKGFARGGSVASPGTGLAYTVLSTGTLTSSATPITAAGLYKVLVPAGVVVLLDNTATSGNLVVEWFPSPLA